jgi:hypothetical protein
MTNSNRSLLLRGCDAVVRHLDQVAGGYALMCIGWLDYLNTPIVHTVGEGDSAERDSFLVHELATAKDAKVQGARGRAVLSDVLGIKPDDFGVYPAAAVTARDKTLPAAVVISKVYGGIKSKDNPRGLELVQVPGNGGKLRYVVGNIPAGDMFELLEESGALNKRGRAAAATLRPVFVHIHKREPSPEELVEFILAYPQQADGSTNTLFGGQNWTQDKMLTVLRARGVEMGLLPAPNPKGTAGKVKELAKSLQWVSETLGAVMAVDDDGKPAPVSAEIARMMDNLAESWAAYRAARPCIEPELPIG